jgi:hypothetical protein
MKTKVASISLVVSLALLVGLALLLAAGSGEAVARAAPQTEPSAIAAELHVCPSGCAYSTIQDAVDAAGPSDVIKVAGSTYTGVQARAGITQVVAITKTAVILGSYPPGDWNTTDPVAHPTIVNAQGQGRVFYIDGSAGSPIIVLYNLRITGGDATGLGGGEVDQYEGAGGGLYVTNADIIMENCDVYGNVASRAGWGGGGGVYLLYSDSTLFGNVIHHNTASTASTAFITGEGGGLGMSMSAANLEGNLIHNNVASTIDEGIGGGIYMESLGPTLTRNVIRHNIASVTQRGDGGGIYIGPEAHANLDNNVIMDNVSGVDPTSSGAGILVEIASPTLVHTTIHDNMGGDGSGLATYGFAANTTRMTNTIVSSQTVGVKVDTNQSAVLDGVLFFANGDDTAGAGTITVNPPIVGGNPVFAPDGYHLIFGSPAVDAGLSSVVGADVDNQPRPFGAGYDLGADELVVVTNTVSPSTGATMIYTDPKGLTTTLEIPPGAVLQAVTIIFTPIPTPTHPLLPGLLSVGHNFFLDAYLGGQLLPGFGFQRPVSLTVNYSSTSILGLDESTLGLYYWTGSEWADGSTTCTPPSEYTRDLVADWLRLPICHLTEWNIQGEPLSEAFWIYLPLIVRHAP